MDGLKSFPISGALGSPVEFKADLAKREITAYASIFGNRDSDGDVVVKGAFERTLRERMPKGLIKYFGFHKALIGTLRHAEQDDTGLLTVGRVSKTPHGDEVLTLAADGALTHMSFAYGVVTAKKGKMEDGREANFLHELKLYEVGPVDFPSNEDAVILQVKSALRSRKELWPLAELIGATARVDALRSDDALKIDEDDALVALDALAALLPEDSPLRAQILSFLSEQSSGGQSHTPTDSAGSAATPEAKAALDALYSALAARTKGAGPCRN